ncbi:hypothetical protein ES708_26652 [subsurface metagenome]
MNELKAIFNITGCTDRFEKLENDAAECAKKLNLEYDDTHLNKYFQLMYSKNPNEDES